MPRISTHAYTDSLSLFDVISRSTTTSKKRLMIDITAAKEAYKEGAIGTIGDESWVRDRG
jgi:hypothetical protein